MSTTTTTVPTMGTGGAVPTDTYDIAVIGAGGKMGMRVSDNLVKTAHRVSYSENSPAGRERVTAAGRELTATPDAVRDADIVVLAVPDLALGPVTAEIVPQLKPGAIVLTLDPAAAYAGLLTTRDDVIQAVAHPCHPSIFLQRTTPEEYADTFGGIAAPQDAVAAIESDDPAKAAIVEATVRAIYAPVIDVHRVTIKQLAQLEPTLVETIACMVGALLKEALDEAVNTMGVPEAAARSILLGHTQVALANGLRGDNPFSDACLIAMDYGRESIIKDDWKKFFRDDELDKNLARMLHLDRIERCARRAARSRPPNERWLPPVEGGSHRHAGDYCAGAASVRTDLVAASQVTCPGATAGSRRCSAGVVPTTATGIVGSTAIAAVGASA